MDDATILEAMRRKAPSILAELRALASWETPSDDKAAVDRMGRKVAARWMELGGAVEIVPNDRGGDHLIGRFFGDPDVPPALVLGHIDTVWPIGTLARMPVVRDGDRLRGPGVYDMKAGLAMLHAVLEWLNEAAVRPSRPITALFTADEEIGSPTSRGLIESLARESAHALVLEPPLADGGLKTARKGVGGFTIRVEGKAAHAGVAPEQGVSAILELAHQVIRAHDLNDPAAGTTVNVGVIRGGSTSNVVPARAEAVVDVRATTIAAAEAVERSLLSLRPVTAGAKVVVEGRFNRPPMERSPAIAALFERAAELGARLGLTLAEGSTGGGSDGNFTAAIGLPTLDGLGAPGGGAHADHEHVVIPSLPERAALLAALLLTL